MAIEHAEPNDVKTKADPVELPLGRDWVLSGMAVLGGLAFIGLGSVTVSVFPVAGIIEGSIGASALAGVLISTVLHGR